MDESKPAYRLVAAFEDGQRLTFDGFTWEQASDAMEAAQAVPGGRFSAYSQIVFPALIFGTGKSPQYAHIGPNPKSEIDGDFTIPRRVGPAPSGGMKPPRR